MSDCARCDSLKKMIEEHNLATIDMFRKMAKLHYDLDLAAADLGDALLVDDKVECRRVKVRIAKLELELEFLMEEERKSWRDLDARMKVVEESTPATCEIDPMVSKFSRLLKNFSGPNGLFPQGTVFSA